MAVQNVTDQTFEQETKEGLVLADLGAPWCGPCKMIAPVLDELDEETGEELKIVQLDVDSNPETARKYDVMSIPTLLFFKDGELVENAVGFRTKEELAGIAKKHG
ncbi:thioredoxin [Guptibacillus hwajinpoensis]|uniref:Thioredoxin n=1 Tax=Guptibacillus hwajinpoensis TaxID=208199 RepID=A0ABU0K7F8_9BACL|nr:MULTISPECIES: thioredoxin [Alkalihalobacillus]MDP4552914.1 thioredoxin [Alkalihalobacillus macyae]MDQ0484047.1 thioredoxin 1 [Alkalihalobacillus hemicentroti]